MQYQGLVDNLGTRGAAEGGGQVGQDVRPLDKEHGGGESKP